MAGRRSPGIGVFATLQKGPYGCIRPQRAQAAYLNTAWHCRSRLICR
jgi:hypothetical protein